MAVRRTHEHSGAPSTRGASKRKIGCLATAAALRRLPVPGLFRPSRATFEKDFARRRSPVKVGGLLDDWPALERWNLDFLVEHHGSARLPVARRECEDSVWFKHVGMTLESYVALMRDPGERGHYYLSDAPFLSAVPELARDVRTPEVVRGAPRTALWISTTGKRAFTHFDVDHSLLTQVVGKKRIYLMRPRALVRLHVSPIFDRNWPQSPVDLAAPNLTRFPRMAGAEIFECVIGPGEALFIPALWWHQVHSLEDSVSVSFHWEGRRERLVRFGVRLLGRRYAG
jgi:hypothetical protein